MKAFTTSSELLRDWDSGQGRTNELADIANLSANQLTYDGYTVEVTPVWQEAALVMYLHKELKNKTALKQRATLDIFAQNRLSDNHKFDNDKAVIVKPLPSHYLTSADLRANYCALVDADVVASIYHLLASVNSSMTKDSLLSLISSAKELIITADQAATLVTLEGKEEALVAAQAKLETAGCFDVSFTSDKQIKASVPFVKADTLPALVSDTLKHVPTLDKLGAGCLVMSFDVINQEG
jgi:hypothetical protein